MLAGDIIKHALYLKIECKHIYNGQIITYTKIPLRLCLPEYWFGNLEGEVHIQDDNFGKCVDVSDDDKCEVYNDDDCNY